MQRVFRNIGKIIYTIKNTTEKYTDEIISATFAVGAVGGGIVGNYVFNDEIWRYKYNPTTFQHITYIGLGCGGGAIAGIVIGSICAMYPVGCIASSSIIGSIYLGDKTYKFITNDIINDTKQQSKQQEKNI
jgi:hypothetical protein